MFKEEWRAYLEALRALRSPFTIVALLLDALLLFLLFLFLFFVEGYATHMLQPAVQEGALLNPLPKLILLSFFTTLLFTLLLALEQSFLWARVRGERFTMRRFWFDLRYSLLFFFLLFISFFFALHTLLAAYLFVALLLFTLLFFPFGFSLRTPRCTFSLTLFFALASFFSAILSFFFFLASFSFLAFGTLLLTASLTLLFALLADKAWLPRFFLKYCFAAATWIVGTLILSPTLFLSPILTLALILLFLFLLAHAFRHSLVQLWGDSS